MEEKLIGCKILDDNQHSNLYEMLTLYINNFNPATYWIDDGEEQCDDNRNRSFDDLLLLSKNYYPETTIEELVNIAGEVIEDTVDTNRNIKSIIYYCNDISKPIVWKKSLTLGNKTINGFYITDWDYYTNKNNSQWSLSELHDMVKIKENV